MRFLLSKKSRKELFEFIKKDYNVSSLENLALKMKIPFKTLKKYRYAELYLPSSLIPKEFEKLEILQKKEDNWGVVKGGIIGGNKNVKNLKRLWKDERYKKIRSEAGKRAINILWKRYGIKKLTKMIVEGKRKKRENESLILEKKNENYFTNEEIFLDCKGINFTSSDVKKMIKFPNKITPELAEEIGVHLGDGCLSRNRNYFSVKTSKKEEEYMKYLFKLYKNLYNLDLKMMRLPSVVGFEIYSKALCEFKNKVLGLPYGEKVHRIELPKAVLDTRNKEIYYALIRGLFDTDGCICIVKRNNKDYPVIALSIKSEKLILQVSEILKKLGYLPFHNKNSVALNGVVMFNKWAKEIGSSNSKNFDKLNRASSITG